MGAAFIKMNVSGNDRMDHDVSRRLGKAPRSRVASRVARGGDGLIDHAKSLIRCGFPDRHPQYDIVLM